jgi:hypothetical protein
MELHPIICSKCIELRDSTSHKDHISKCDYCYQTNHETIHHMCDICGRNHDKEDHKCTICEKYSHLASQHKCKICSELGHGKSDHCKQCNKLGHCISDHCTRCGIVGHSKSAHYCHFTECTILYGHKHTCDYCADCGHTTAQHICPKCGQSGHSSHDHYINAYCGMCKEKGHSDKEHIICSDCNKDRYSRKYGLEEHHYCKVCERCAIGHYSTHHISKRCSCGAKCYSVEPCGNTSSCNGCGGRNPVPYSSNESSSDSDDSLSSD